MALHRATFSIGLLMMLAAAACSAGGGGDKTFSGSAGSGAGSGAGAGGSSGGTGGNGGGDLTTIGSTGSGTPIPSCGSTLEVTYRDFNDSHPDFEMDFSGDVVRLQLVEPTLGADLTPVFKSSIGCPQDPNNPAACANWTATQPVITGADTYSDWYHTKDGTNMKFTKNLELTETPAGSGNFVFDSTAFFPLGPEEGFGVTPPGNSLGKNFLFTTEIHVNFEYKAGQKFTFRGDDDLWIFVNNKIALDLGSMHSAVEGTIDFDKQAAALGIKVGETYPMDIFQAERHTVGSNFRFETNISCFTPGPVPK